MADQLNVSHEFLQLEYDSDPNLRLSQLFLQVEYVDPNDVVMDCPMFIVT